MLVFKKINNLHIALDKLGLNQEADNLLKLADAAGISENTTLPAKIINLEPGNELRFRSEPNPNSLVLGGLFDGDTFEYLGEKRNDFLKIRVKGVEGWVHSSYVEYSDPSGKVIFRGEKPPESGPRGIFNKITDKLFGKEEDSKESFPVGSGKFSSPVVGNPLITSKFGWRMHPILKKRKHHNGADIRAREGAPLLAVEDGVIEKVGDMGTAGNTVVLKGSDGREWSYMHLSSFSVKSGDMVSAGQEVGKSGTTGRSTAAHLHLQLKVNGSVKDPLPTFDELGISYSFKHKD